MKKICKDISIVYQFDYYELNSSELHLKYLRKTADLSKYLLPQKRILLKLCHYLTVTN